MDKKLYEMIFKRKSFHLFRNIGNDHINEDELNDIEKEFSKLKPLVDDIKVKIRIVKKNLYLGDKSIVFYSILKLRIIIFKILVI